MMFLDFNIIPLMTEKHEYLHIWH